MPLPNYYDQGQQNLQSAFKQAADTTSARSRDTAAARVRSRLANQNRGQINQIQGAATRNTGLMNSRLNAQGRAHQNAYATGLADVEQDYRTNQVTAARTMGEIAGTQGTLSNAFQQNQTESQDVANRLELGQGQIAVDQVRNQETERQNRMQELQNFYNAFATSGATLSESDAFNRRFNDLIARLFGTQGLAAGDPDPAPVPSDENDPAVAGNLHVVD